MTTDKINQDGAAEMLAAFDNDVAAIFKGGDWMHSLTLPMVAQKAGTTEDSAKAALSEMVKAGALRSYIARGKGRGSSYNGKRVYEVNFA